MVTETPTTFGASLRRHRLAAGLTQEQLAERAGLSVFGIQKLERGTTQPYRDTVARLTAALELAPGEAERFRAAVEPARRRRTTQRDAPRADRNHNLPVALTSFVGREQELTSVPLRLRGARLLALTGVGGSGKTRLAIELARQMVEGYRNGVWVVELAQIAEPAFVAHRVAAVLGVHGTAGQTLEQALADALRDSQIMLVLDNCEHLLDACASLLDSLLRECQGLQVLATSREPIGVPGEVTWNLSPLASPDDPYGSIAEIERFPAVRLLVERASAAQPSFVLSAETATAVAQICRRLDGIPLALELAAARLDALTPAELVSRLDQRFALLAGGNRVAQPRQQTLSATIDWSYVLLSETQRRVFERLSVFANGWTLDAAEGVCAGDSIAHGDVLDAVLQLVRKSLAVRIDVRHGTARYGLLETLRQYAWDKLRERGADLAVTQQRHTVYYSELVARLDPAGATTLLPFSGQAVTAPVFEILNAAQDNVQVALRWWLETRRAAEGLDLIRALGALWFWNGFPIDGRQWVEAMLDLAAAAPSSVVPPAQYAHALMFASQTALLQGDRARAHSFVEASVALWRALDDPLGLAMALGTSSSDHLVRGDLNQGDALADEAVALARTGAEPFTLCMALTCRGMASLLRGQHDSAAALLRESLAVGQTVERASHRAMAVIRSLVRLGRVESERGATDTAISLFRDALAQMRDSGVTGYLVGFGLAWMADALARAGETAHAARLFGAAEAQLRRAGVSLNPVMQLSPRDGMRVVQAQLGRDAFASTWSEGFAMHGARAFAYALDELA